MNDYEPTILPADAGRQDDDIMAAHSLTGTKESPLVILEMLQRLRVRDVMKADGIVSVVRSDTLHFAQNLMKRNSISGVPVLEEGRLFGIVSVNIIIKALEGGYIQDPCHKHMSTSLVFLEEGMPLALAIKYFQNYTFGRFPVLDKDRKFVGIVSQRDIMRAILKELAEELARYEGKNPAAATVPFGEVSTSAYTMQQYPVVHNDLQNAGRAANEIKRLLAGAGIDKKIVRRIAVAAYELEINIAIHSVGGTLTFILDGQKATIIARDRGPGIADIEWALRDGTSTANDWVRSMGFGAGMGLANSKRVSDKFEIKSVVPSGTTVLCEFNLKKD